jgi:hypothetical protein
MSQAVATVEDSAMLDFIERAARDPEFDVVKLEALLRMRRDMEHDFAKRQFNNAMAEAQAEMMPVIRDATNAHTSSKYAKLETIDREMRPVYTRHGFSVRYGSAPPVREGWIRITCTVAHSGGYFEENYLDAPPDVSGSQGKTNKTPIQAVGSSVTYLRRYLLAMVFNIVLATDDDDDDGARLRKTTTVTRPEQPKKPLALLDEPNKNKWLLNVEALCKDAATIEQLTAIAGHHAVRAAIANAPTMIRNNIQDWLRDAHERLAPVAAPPETETTWEDDPIGGLLSDVEAMTIEDIDRLRENAAWQARVRDLFPPDEDRLNEAIAARRAMLGKANRGNDDGGASAPTADRR